MAEHLAGDNRENLSLGLVLNQSDQCFVIDEMIGNERSLATANHIYCSMQTCIINMSLFFSFTPIIYLLLAHLVCEWMSALKQVVICS